MTSEFSSTFPHGADPSVWWFAGALVTVDALAIWWLGWTISPTPILAVSIAVGAFLVIGTVARHDPRLARLAPVCEALAQLCLLINAAWIATYLATATNTPLRDAEFRAADLAIGFRWESWAAWSGRHPTFHALTAWAYQQHVRESLLVVGAVAVYRPDGARPLLRALSIAFLVTLVVSAAYPALGTVQDVAWEGTFRALRDGTFHVVGDGAVQALVSMPSFHAVLAVLFAIAWWPLRWVRWPALGFNALMLVATVRWGAHYLVDVLAGVALALAAAWLAGMFRRDVLWEAD